jgi:hypothetical protein
MNIGGYLEQLNVYRLLNTDTKQQQQQQQQQHNNNNNNNNSLILILICWHKVRTASYSGSTGK